MHNDEMIVFSQQSFLKGLLAQRFPDITYDDLHNFAEHLTYKHYRFILALYYSRSNQRLLEEIKKINQRKDLFMTDDPKEGQGPTEEPSGETKE